MPKYLSCDHQPIFGFLWRTGAIATYACISYIICIVYLLLQGVGDGSQPLMSQFCGAGEEKSLKQTKTLAYEFSMVLAVISAILIYLLRGKIGLLFGSSAEVNAGVIKVMPIFLVAVPFDAITSSTAAFYATEKSVLSYVLTFIEPIIMLVLMLMLPPVFGGQIMIWWSAVFAKVITASVSIVLSVRYSAQRNR
ncbi:MAG: MATE family efflux transporter [Eubacteriales bacterium]